MLQDFSPEQDITRSGKINAAQRARYVCLAACIVPYVTYFIFMEPASFLVPFTNWTLILTTVSLITSIQAANDTINFGKDGLHRGELAVWLQARHHMLYTLSIVCNFICVFFYWFLLRDEQR